MHMHQMTHFPVASTVKRLNGIPERFTLKLHAAIRANESRLCNHGVHARDGRFG